MKKEKLYRLLENGPVYLDGATGSNLQKAGMPTGCLLYTSPDGRCYLRWIFFCMHHRCTVVCI